MTRSEVLKNRKLLKRFCKDAGIQINVFHEPYFSQRIEILDPFFKTKEKFDLFVSELESFETVQDYFEYYNKIKDRVIQDIKANPAFQKFNNDSFDCYNEYVSKHHYSTRDCYKMELDKKQVISIDMKKANFSALRYYDPEIFYHAESWKDFLSRYTDFEHIIQSKYIRQVIMGTCNPKRQVRYEKYLMCQLLDCIKLHTEVEVFSLSNDELILTMTEPGLFFKILSIVSNSKFKDMMKVQLFDLEKLPVTDGWKRVSFDGEHYSVDFKKMNSDYFHQAVKYARGEEITEDDLVVYHDGHLARLLEPVFEVKCEGNGGYYDYYEDIDQTYYQVWHRGTLSDFEWQKDEKFTDKNKALTYAEEQAKRYCGADYRITKEHITSKREKEFINNTYLYN